MHVGVAILPLLILAALVVGGIVLLLRAGKPGRWIAGIVAIVVILLLGLFSMRAVVHTVPESVSMNHRGVNVSVGNGPYSLRATVDGNGPVVQVGENRIGVSRDGVLVDGGSSFGQLPPMPVMPSMPSMPRMPKMPRMPQIGVNVGVNETAWRAMSNSMGPADVYPSMASAGRALAGQLEDDLRAVVSGDELPAVVHVCGRIGSVMDGGVDADTLNAVAAELRDELGIERALVETVVPTSVIQATNEHGATVEVSLVQWSHSVDAARKATSNEPVSAWQPSPGIDAGTLKVRLAGRAGSIERTMRFVHKPWVDRFGEYVSRNPQRALVLGLSHSPAMSEFEAEQQAMQDAVAKVQQRLREMGNVVNGHLVSVHAGSVTQADLRQNDIIVDRFVQEFPLSVGQFWREALLLDVSDEKLASLIVRDAARSRVARSSWFRAIGSVVVMVAVICLLYLFVNVATRGYYTWALRVAAVVLVIAGLVLVRIVFSAW